MTTCKLCHGPGPLRNSHIIPEFLYGPLYESDDHRFSHFDIESGDRTIKQKGLRERLLCPKCESPLLSDLEGRFSQDVVIPDSVPGPDLQLAVDYGQVKLCLLSILWRASVSSLDAFAEVKLGPQHEERIRQMLLAGDPKGELDYPIRGHLVMKVDSQTEIAKRVVTFPATRRDPDHGYRLYGFTAAGVMWSFFVTAPGDGGRADISLFEDDRLVLKKATTPRNMPLVQAFEQ